MPMPSDAATSSPACSSREAKHDDRLLGLAQLIDARAETHVLLGFRDERLRARAGRESKRQRIHVVVGLRDAMRASLVARDVADDAAEVERPLLGIRRQLVLLRDLQERDECILHVFHGVFRGRALPLGSADEIRAAALGEVTEEPRGRRVTRYRRRKPRYLPAMGDISMYSDSSGVRNVAADTFCGVGEKPVLGCHPTRKGM